MKTLIIALNSKYIHSALAPWYLKASCGPECGEVCVVEHTVNENPDTVLSSIYLKKPDIAAFSCYIWNISHVLKLAANLKKVLPGIVIILGGPEVSYDAGDILERHSYIDYVLAGEGEQSFPRLIACIARHSGRDDDCLEQINGLAWRSEKGIVAGKPTIVENLDQIPTPYTDEMISSLKNRIVYFESSRGCPFSCSYCLSSASEGVRYFSLERVFSELDKLVASGVAQIKFVDRTFNANKKRAAAIIKHILDLSGGVAPSSGNASIGSVASSSGCKISGSGINCNFHFEVGADLFDDVLMQLLQNAPRGLFQIEAGVQSVNEKTLKAICRKTDTSKLLYNMARLKENNNVHIHADLIAGLPYEDYSSFRNSFNRVYEAGPNHLQLGFLKFLKGTRLREQSMEEGFVYRDYPPYEVLSGRHISYGELVVLKGIAELVERYHNSGRFYYSIEFAVAKCFESPFDFYESFYYFQKENGNLENPVSLRELYHIFYQFIESRVDEENRLVFRELLRLDFLASDSSGKLPDFLENRDVPGFNDQCFAFLRDTGKVAAILHDAVDKTPKQLFKRVRFEKFNLDITVGGALITYRRDDRNGTVLMFDYHSRDKVTNRFPFYRVQFESCQE